MDRPLRGDSERRGPEDGAAALAERLQAIRPQLLDSYRQALVEQGNPLGTNPEAWLTCHEQAEHVVADCLATLRHGGESPFDAGLVLKTRRLGGARISQGIAPIHSVRAGSLLFQVTMDHLSRICADRPGWERHLIQALLGLQSSIIRRLEQGAIGHDLFLLDVVRDAAQQGRNSMAREIHDRIGGAASVALRQLELYELSQLPDSRLTALKQAIRETQHITRDLVTELRNRADTTRSLQVALSSFVTAMALDKTTVEIRVEDPGDHMPPGLADDLYLMLRECLRNAFAHASATRIDIAVVIEDGLIRASVHDNGIGFDPERRRGHGLASMVERARLLGGQLEINSSPGEGTVVDLIAPIDKENRARHE